MGADMQIWWQGPFYPDLGTGIIHIDAPVEDGPGDSFIKIIDGHSKSTSGRRFVWGNDESTLYSEVEKNAIHTYAVAKKMIQIFEKYSGRPVRWYWHNHGDHSPLLFRIDVPDIYCGYSRENKCIEMGVYTRQKSTVYNCRTVDLVVHETGHAILDGIKPHWYNGGNIEARGLAESFADSMSMIWILSFPHLIAYFLNEAGDELRDQNILCLFAAGHGFEHIPGEAFRTANNSLVFGPMLKSSYDYGSLISGLLYDLLADIYHQRRKTSTEDPASLMHTMGASWARLILTAMLSLPDEAPRIRHFADQLLKAADPWMREYVTKHLRWRKIL